MSKLDPPKPKIVVLDSKPLDNNDLDWSPLEAIGDLTLYDDSEPEQVLDRIRDAQIIFTNKVKITGDNFDRAPRPRLVNVTATGYDIIDLAGARRNHVTVCNVPGYSANFTAQTAIALLMELTHYTGEHDQAVKLGQWTEVGRFSFWNYPLLEVHGKTLLIIGLGNIGTRVAKIAEAMGMNVIVAKLPGRESSGGPYHRMPLEFALPEADVISLHCPLTPETREIINANTIAMMKPTVRIVNNSRGLLVDEAAVAQALHDGRMCGYAADVLSKEPPDMSNPLLHAPRCIITPHLSWASIESRERLLNTSIANVQAFLDGKSQNVVS